MLPAAAILLAVAALWLLWDRGVIGISTAPFEEEASISDFEGLPYLSYVKDDPNPEMKGVALYDPDLSYPGLNLLTSRLIGGAHLLNMEGEIVHSWAPGDATGRGWVYSEMDEAGNLFVLAEDVGLVKMDWDSDIIWVSRAAENPLLSSSGKVAYHHDFAVTENGDVYVLAVDVRDVKRRGNLKTIRDNSIVVLDCDGRPQRKISLYDIFREVIPEAAFEQKKRKYPRLRKHFNKIEGFDVLHANTIEELPRDIAVGRRGDLLFCIRNLNLIGILDAEKERIVWTWGPGMLDRPHHPTVLENGNILIFDNGTLLRKHSRIVEIDPATTEIVWKYESDPPDMFFSSLRGSNQRLPNGNTLITESEKGHVFEVTPNGEIVWDFWNFESNETGLRGIIYRMTRYDAAYLGR